MRQGILLLKQDWSLVSCWRYAPVVRVESHVVKLQSLRNRLTDLTDQAWQNGSAWSTLLGAWDFCRQFANPHADVCKKSNPRPQRTIARKRHSAWVVHFPSASIVKLKISRKQSPAGNRTASAPQGLRSPPCDAQDKHPAELRSHHTEMLRFRA